MLLRQEVADPKKLSMFYREVIQELLIFGDETWVLSEAMEWKVEEKHTVFIWHITRKRA